MGNAVSEFEDKGQTGREFCERIRVIRKGGRK